ncbi:MAG: hypothetical protein QXL17_07235 [Candidatus Thermoplasmatota archaeon]
MNKHTKKLVIIAVVATILSTMGPTAISTPSPTGISKSSSPVSTKPTPDAVNRMILSAPNNVTEGQTFLVFVTTVSGKPIEKAVITVGWNNRSYYTNSNGVVELTAPLVDNTTTFFIKAKKQGYKDAVTYITVKNVVVFLPLEIHAPAQVQENTQFYVVITSFGLPVPYVHISYQYMDLLTDMHGNIHSWHQTSPAIHL